MATTDLYATLGVPRGASADEIRKAYRALAKKHHPDLNPGNKAAEDRFKTASAAYDILGDADKRARYDRGEIDETGAEAPPEHPSYRGYADGAQGWRYRQPEGETMSEADLGDLFENLFGAGAARGQAGTGPRRGRDQHYTLTVEFLDTVTGARKRLALPEGKGLDVRIPPGIEEGQTLRLKGQGSARPPGRPGRGRLDRNPHRSASFLQAGRAGHSRRSPCHPFGSGARRQDHGADAHRPGDDDGTEAFRYRPGAPPARPRRRGPWRPAGG